MKPMKFSTALSVRESPTRLRNYPVIAFCAIALGGAVWSRRRRRAAATATN